MSDKDQKKVAAARARASALSKERRTEIARCAAEHRWAGVLPVAEYEGSFNLGDANIGCAVLPNGTRIITQATFLRALGRSRSPRAGAGVLSTVDELPVFLQADALKQFISNDLRSSTKPVFYYGQSGAKGVGYDARLLPQVAEVYLKFRDHCVGTTGQIPLRYERMIHAADILMRALANVGIIALVDEATGYQRDRAKDALAKILEAFVAKELQPWIKTFPDEYYEQLFRLRGLAYPKDSVKRPQYFGCLTNDIVYGRIAPGVLDELKRTTPKSPTGRLKNHLHRRLTPDLGHPKLHEHMASIVTAMKLSDDYSDFKKKLDHLHPRYGETLQLEFEDEEDTGL
ncbi:MAG: P63C domain-containing protein [Beijerinckiaceae bacterium]|nr:P63C domain-containing protein [Beijerinckiaceae bacterium]